MFDRGLFVGHLPDQTGQKVSGYASFDAWELFIGVHRVHIGKEGGKVAKCIPVCSHAKMWVEEMDSGGR